MMRVAFCLLNDSGPPSTYIHVDGHRYVLVAHAADQMQVAIESEGDPIVRGFDAQIRRAEQQIADIHASIRVRELAIKIAQAYTFEVDRPEPNPMDYSLTPYGFDLARHG